VRAKVTTPVRGVTGVVWERLRGGEPIPLGGYGGVQPPRACFNVPFETSRTLLQVARQGTARIKRRLLVTSMPDAVARVER